MVAEFFRFRTGIIGIVSNIGGGFERDFTQWVVVIFNGRL